MSSAATVAPKDLVNEKKHLTHVPLADVTPLPSGGVHLGPGRGQGDFAASQTVAHSTHSAIDSHSAGGNHSSGVATRSGEISVQSSVVIDTTQETQPQAAAQIQSLLARLSSTTKQIDDYSRRQNEQISKEANEKIQQVIGSTQRSQDLLLKDASSRSLEIEGEYSNKLKSFLQELDASKASNLAALERDLNFRQEQLLTNAREEMDAIHQNATQQKIGVMQQANREAIRDVDDLTDRVKVLGEAEVERRMNSTTKTVITTQTTTESAVDVNNKQEPMRAAAAGEQFDKHGLSQQQGPTVTTYTKETIVQQGEPRTQ